MERRPEEFDSFLKKASRRLKSRLKAPETSQDLAYGLDAETKELILASWHEWLSTRRQKSPRESIILESFARNLLGRVQTIFSGQSPNPLNQLEFVRSLNASDHVGKWARSKKIHLEDFMEEFIFLRRSILSTLWSRSALTPELADLTSEVLDHALIVGVCEYYENSLSEKDGDCQAANEKLWHEQRYFEQMLEQIPVGIVIAEVPSGRLVFYNHEVPRLLRRNMRPAKNYDAQSHWGALHEDLSPFTPQELPLARTIETGEVCEVQEVLCRRGDNSLGWLSVRSAPIRNDQGKVTAAVCIGVDITNRKMTEDRLARINRDLQDFAATVAHDLKAPLKTVSNYVDALTPHFGDEGRDGRDYSRLILEATDRMQVLVDSLLEFSRAGQGEIQTLKTDLEGVFVEALKNLDYEIQTSSAQITRSSLPEVEADRAQILQVFQNILSNAIKFSGSSRPIVHVDYREEPESWLLRFRDNGIGIPHERLNLIFSPLYHEKGEDVGLGLSICQRIVERHGGKIWAESTVGEGSTICVRLPKRASVQSERPRPIRTIH